MCLTLFQIVLAALIAAPADAAESPADLVRKLGDKSFKVRTEAAMQLVKLGSAALPALTDGSSHPDLEVADQCRKLIPQAIAKDQEEKLAEFLRHPEAPPPRGLAGAEQFFKVTGDSKAAREVYVDLMKQHRDAMLARESDPKAASDMFVRYGEEMHKRMRERAKTAKTKFELMVTSRTELTFYFVFAADPSIKIVPKHYIFQWMLVMSPTLRDGLTEGEHSAVMRKLFTNWLFNEQEDLFQQAGFELVAQTKMPDFLPQAVRVINDPAASAKVRAMAMVSLRQVGSKEHVKILTPHLTDKTEVYVATLGAGLVFRTQLRDVALGMSVHLAGEGPDQYGLSDRRFGVGRGAPQCLYFYGFQDQASRDGSHAKWKEWLKKNPEFLPPSETGPAPREVGPPGQD
jgi:hypothetical protein